MQPRRILLLVGAVFMLCLSVTLLMMNTNTAPTSLVHKRDNVNHTDIAVAAISPQTPHNISPLRSQVNRHDIQQRKVEKHEVERREYEEEEFEEEEAETNPGFQKQLEMMLRDPKTGAIPDGIGYREREFTNTLPSRSGTAGRKFREKGTSELQASNLTWQVRGPLNIGGRTRTVAIDITNENVILAAGVGGGGIWRSTNKGQSWTRMISNPQAPNATSLVQDKRPGKQNIWYCGTGEFFSSGFPTRMQGILKSTDGGLTWQPSPSTMGLGTVQNIFSVVTQTKNLNQDEVLAATNGGIMRSVNGGASWTTVIATSTNSARTHVAISSTGVLYAVVSDANRRVYRSTDGTNWTDISPPNLQSSTQALQRGILAVAPSNPNTVYLAFSTPFGSDGIVFMKYGYLSGDGSGTGGTWENRTNNVLNSPVVNFKSGTQGGYCMLLDVHPQNENAIFLGGVRLYRSMDGFQTPSQVSGNSGIHPDHHAITFFSDGRAVAANDGGVYISVGNTLQAVTIQWSSLNSGYINSQFYHIAIDEQTPGSNVIMGGMQDNGTFLTATGGLSTWQMTGSGDGAFSAITNWGANKMVYSSYQNGNIYARAILNSAGSLSNYSFSRIDPINAPFRQFIHPYYLDPNSDSVMYYPSGGSLWRHDNLPSIPANGYDQIAGWKQFTNITPGGITAIAAAKGATTRLYVGSGPTLIRIDDARSASLSALNISNGLPAFGNIQCIAIDPTNPNRAIVVFSNYNVQSLFYTTDAGSTWQPIGGNLEQFPNGTGNGPACLSAAIVNYQGQTTYFVGTSAGLYSTTTLNGMSTVWMLEDGVPPGVAVMHIAKRDADGFVAVATHGAGVYSAFLGGAPPVSTVSLTGVVRENASPLQPLQGVTVTLSNGAQTTTNAAGAYSFTNLPKGAYSVTVNFPNGYYAATKTVLKDLSQQSGTQDFLLETIKISGKITVNNVGLANVSVSNGAGMTVLTNAQGDYLFNKVNAGSYTVTPTLAGFTCTPVNRAVSISNTPNPPAPTVYGTATAMNFTAQGTLNVNASALTIMATGVNNAPITVNANVAWTVVSSQAWASVTPTSGTGNGSFAVSVAANPNTTTRTATLTITGGGITRTVAITQNGTVPAALTVSQQAFTVPTGGQSGITASITSNVAWTASSNQAWATVTPANGTNNGILTINVAVNPTTTQRTANITITGGGITRTITITQDAAIAPNLQVNTTALTAPAAGQNGITASVTSNVAWTASSNQAWVTLTPANGTNNGTLTINVAANAATTQRTAAITITGGGITRTITITQNAAVAAPTLLVNVSAFTAPAAGQNSITASIASNVMWTASSNQAFVTVTPANGTNNGTLSINVAANPTTTQRTANITITGGGITRTITITQNAATPAPTLLVNVSTLTAPAAGQNGLTVSVASNVAWTASSNQAFVTVTPTSGTNSGTLSINVAANPTTTPRTATITVTGGGLTQTITLTQSGMQTNALVAPVITMITNIGTSAFTLTWGAVSGAVSYQAMIATDNAFTQNVLSGSSTTTSFAVSGRAPGTTYFYRVRAVAADGGFSAWSNVGQYTTPPPAPTAFAPSSISPTSVTVSWSRVTSATRYDVELAQNAAFSPLRASYSTTFGNPIPTTATFTITNPSLPAGSTCYYRVRAYLAGAPSPVSAYSTPVAFVIPTLLLTMKTSPNPSSDILRIEADLSEVAREISEVESVMLRLVDARGSLIQEQYVLSNGKRCTAEFDVHSLQAGTYLVELVFRSDGVTIRRTEKFIKQ